MRTIHIKFILVIAVILSVAGCTEKKSSAFKNYKAVAGDTTGILSLAESNSYFYGRYEVYYGISGKDSGNVKGNRIVDTLKGIYTYKSYRGNLVSRPVIFLKSGNDLRLGRVLKHDT